MTSKTLIRAGLAGVAALAIAALLTDAGVLVGRVPIEPQRLMPGERLAFRADYPTLVTPGRYRVLLSLADWGAVAWAALAGAALAAVDLRGRP